MYKVRQLVLASVLLVVTALAGTPAQAAPVAAGHPAVWTPHDLIVSFEHLPRIYSCDDLWYKMKDGLFAALPDRVLNFNLACEAPATRWPFSVSVEALTPVDGQARMAATGAATSKPY